MNKTIQYTQVFLLLLSYALIPSISHSEQSNWDYKKVKGAAECAECHEEAVEVWKETKHYKGFKKFSQLSNSKKIAKKMGIKHIKRTTSVCTSCHYTVGNKNRREKIVAGVSCESCHGPSADWLEVHNDFGGKDVKKEQESAPHKKERYAKVDTAGMIRPGNIYGLARNCYDCHIVANEKLVNQGGHKAGSEFDFIKRTQGKIKHSPDISNAKKQVMSAVGYAVELELSLRALSQTTTVNTYSDKMVARAKQALSNLEKNAKAPSLKSITTMVSAANIKAGNASLAGLSDKIASKTKQFVSDKTGHVFTGNPASPNFSQKQSKTTTKAIQTTVKKTTAKTNTPASAQEKHKVNIVKAPIKQTQPAPRQQVSKPQAYNNSVPRYYGNNNAGSVDLLAELIIKAPQQSLCNTKSPWMLGETVLSEESRLGKDGCVLIDIKAKQQISIYLLQLQADGGIFKILPDKCESILNLSNRLQPGQQLLVPVDKNKRAAALKLYGVKGSIWIYAIATNDDAVKTSLQYELSGAGSSCDDSRQSQKVSIREFQNLLTKIKQRNPGKIQWKTKKFELE